MEEGILKTLRSIHGRGDSQNITFDTWKRGFSEHCVLNTEEEILQTLLSIHGRVDAQKIAFHARKSGYSEHCVLHMEEGILRTLLYSYKKHTYLIVLPMGNTSICLTYVPLFQATIGLVHILYTVYLYTTV